MYTVELDHICLSYSLFVLNLYQVRHQRTTVFCFKASIQSSNTEKRALSLNISINLIMAYISMRSSLLWTPVTWFTRIIMIQIWQNIKGKLAAFIIICHTAMQHRVSHPVPRSRVIMCCKCSTIWKFVSCLLGFSCTLMPDESVAASRRKWKKNLPNRGKNNFIS